MQRDTAMNVSLTPQLEEFIKNKVATGMYGNASEVVREALRLLNERDKFQLLHNEVAAGFEQIERGEGIPYTSTTMEKLRQDAIKASTEGHHINPIVMP